MVVKGSELDDEGRSKEESLRAEVSGLVRAVLSVCKGTDRLVVGERTKSEKRRGRQR